MLDLEPIKAREQAASDGPWTVKEYDDDDDSMLPKWVYVASPRGYNVGTSHGVNVMDEPLIHDAEFIAHARVDVPALIAEVEQWRAAILPFLEDVDLIDAAATDTATVYDLCVSVGDVRRVRVLLGKPANDGPPYFSEDAARWHAATESAVQSIVGEWIDADKQEVSRGPAT